MLLKLNKKTSTIAMRGFKDCDNALNRLGVGDITHGLGSWMSVFLDIKKIKC